jgi:uncharacterized protein (DUF362 family)/Pyruvate/2-oxoacid:ferredoxin oxidoreductase delta subunit
MKSQVALVRCRDYNQEEVYRAVREAVELIGGIERYVKPGEKVLLKVNMLAPANPERAITTHPSIVRAMIELVKEADGRPLIGDCPGFEGQPNIGLYSSICSKTGIKEVAEEGGAEIVHLSSESCEVENPQGYAFKRFTLAKSVAECVISLPKLKTHQLTLFTGAVKNNFGLIPGKLKREWHLRLIRPEDFSQMLVDLLACIKPRLVVMDAVVGMEGEGPRGGRPKEIGALIASSDPVAVDAIACAIVGIPPLEVPTTRLANEQGLGIGDLSRIEVLGKKIEEMRVEGFKRPLGAEIYFRIPRPFMRLMRKLLTARPIVDEKRCKRCLVCVEHCPPGAISMDKRHPLIDYEKCIMCYCCHELCPNDAIYLSRFTLQVLR